MIDHTLFLVLIGVIILSAVTSVLGVFVMLGGQSLFSDVIAHASLPGIAAIFLATHSRHPLTLLGGAVMSSAFGAWVVALLERTTILKKDTILGIVLSVFFGFGLVLMAIAQRTPVLHKIQFHKILFGTLATIIPEDLVVLGVVATIVFASLAFFWKEFVIITFDELYALSIGYPVSSLRSILMMLVLLTVITGLQIVGIMLMSSMLIAPAAAAYQWCTQLPSLATVSLCIGVSAGVVGAFVSCIMNIPTGPTIIIMLNMIVFFSVLFGKERGIL